MRALHLRLRAHLTNHQTLQSDRKHATVITKRGPWSQGHISENLGKPAPEGESCVDKVRLAQVTAGYAASITLSMLILIGTKAKFSTRRRDLIMTWTSLDFLTNVMSNFNTCAFLGRLGSTCSLLTAWIVYLPP